MDHAEMAPVRSNAKPIYDDFKQAARTCSIKWGFPELRVQFSRGSNFPEMRVKFRAKDPKEKL
jgi:hypothetical protein